MRLAHTSYQASVRDLNTVDRVGLTLNKTRDLFSCARRAFGLWGH